MNFILARLALCIALGAGAAMSAHAQTGSAQPAPWTLPFRVGPSNEEELRAGAPAPGTAAIECLVNACGGRQREPPPEVRREIAAWQQAAGNRACESAANDLIWTRDGPLNKWILPNAGVSREIRWAYLNQLDTYLANCFSTQADFARAFPRADAAISQVVGILINHRLANDMCSAARFGRFVLTARHCVLSPRAKFLLQTGATRIDLDPIVDHRFYSASEPGRARTVRLATEFYAPMQEGRYRPEIDWAVLELTDLSGLDTRTPDVGFAEPVDYDRLFISGPQPNAYVAALIRAGYPEAIPRIAPPMTTFVDMRPICRVGARFGPLILHACQTEFGTSGGAFFTIDPRSGRPSLAAMQVSAANNYRTADASFEALKDAFGNLAIVLPADVVDFLRRQ